MLFVDTNFIKTNSFIHLGTNFWKIFSLLKQDLKILIFFDLKVKLKILALFLSLKDNTDQSRREREGREHQTLTISWRNFFFHLKFLHMNNKCETLFIEQGVSDKK